MASIWQSLDYLARSVLLSAHSSVAVTPSIALGEKLANNEQLVRKARIASYETLLAYRRDDSLLGDIFDQLYIKCCEVKFRRDNSAVIDADSLIGLVDKLRDSELSADTVSVLKFLLALADTGALEDRPTAFVEAKKCFGSITSSSERDHVYKQYSRDLFQGVDCMLLQKGFYNHFDPKLFEQCPGFATPTSKLSCHRFSSPLSETVAPTLYGALSQPLKDFRQLDLRLDFPELLEESPAPSIPLTPYREPAALTVQRVVPLLVVEEDEGFVETTETPSSGCSFSRTSEYVDYVFSDVFEKDGLHAVVGKRRHMTWESHGSLHVHHEKPFLSEAGEQAVDEVLSCLHHDLSLVNPNYHPIRCINVSVADLIRDAISVMIGIPSRSFTYDEEKCSFSLFPVTVSGLSANAVEGMLKHFPESGQSYLRLDAACRLAKQDSKSLVQNALFDAVGSYLRHYQRFVEDLPKKVNGGGLLQLSVLTSKFCRQICLIFRLLATNGDPIHGENFFRQLPRGVRLLRLLYDTFESIPSGSAVDDRVVLLSFFVAACQPYIRYVRSWAFEGRLLDPHNEFPVACESDFLLLRDDQFWRRSLRLIDDTVDPLLGSSLTSVFVCGKSLHLLRLCCPQHHLFTSTLAAPSLEIAFSEARQKELVSISERYFVAVKEQVDRSTLSRELNRLLDERGKEELFRQARMASRFYQMQRERENNRRREAHLAKKRLLMADLKAQMEDKCAKMTPVADDSHSDATFGSLLKEVTVTLSKLSAQDALPDSTEDFVTSTILDSNMNLTGTENFDAELDPNANEDVTLRVDEMSVWQKDSVSTVVGSTEIEGEEEDAGKGVKRKQDRDSIDFDNGGLARRVPVSCNVQAAPGERPVQSPESISDFWMSENRSDGVLVESNTCAELRTRGRSVHGHASDSTIQKLIYGDSSGTPVGGALRVADRLTKSSEDLPHEFDLQVGLPVSICTNLRSEPYTAEFDELNKLPMVDIFQPVTVVSEASAVDDVSPDVLFRLPLSVVLQKCLTAPLRAQVSCVDSCLLEYFLVTLRIEDHLMALRNYFFLQDGEFGQTLSDLLFERLSATSYPSELLNPVVLNPILANALAFSSAENRFEENIAFVVKYMPESFHPNSPSALNCLQLSYRVEWPLNIVISSDDMERYQQIFSFVLQIRRCMWSLGNVFSLLKDVDTRYDVASSPQYRSLQFFRHEMLHFIRSLYEYIGVQAFQTTWFRLRQQMDVVRNLDALVTAHSKYLRQISFRCLLHKKAVSVMKVVQDVFAIVLKFRSQLLSASWRLNEKTDSIEIDCFPQLCSSFASFRDHSTYLYKVISKLAQRGYQTHLTELSLSLDFNGYYSNQAAQMRDVSASSSLCFSASYNQSI